MNFSETATPYVYRHLASDDEIRILAVKKGAESEWRYNLQHTTLSKAPRFETVSYVWGNDVRENLLTLEDNTVLWINDNLKKALPYLSTKCETGYLWIDQLCIDQSSVNERNHQVKLMGQIYTKGCRVLVWLNHSRLLSRRMHEIIRVCEKSLQARESVPILKDKISAQLAIGGRHIFTELVQILSNSWFSRAWVFQEIVLSREPVFLLGYTAMPFLALSWISRTAFLFALSPSGKSVLSRPRRKAILSEENRWYALIKVTHGHKILPAMHQSWYEATRRQDISETQPFNHLLSRMSSISKTTDARDLVYAFLGLQANPNIHIEPRYTSTYEEVLVDAASSIIKGGRSLQIFEDVCRRETSEGFSIPSWVPDWRAQLISPPLRYNRGVHPHRHDYGFPASERCHKWKDTDSIYELSVRGKVVDTVAVIFEPAFEYRTSNWSRENLKDYISLDERLADIQREAGLSSHIPSRLQLLNVIMANQTWPKLYEDSVTASGSSLSDLLQAYDEYLIAEKDGQDIADGYHLQGLRFFTYIANGRRVFMSDKKNFGLATRAQPSDKICVLHGCSSPVILRSCGSNRFSVVENCFFENARRKEDITWSEEEADTFILV